MHMSLVFICFLVHSLCLIINAKDYKIVCYFTNWAVQRPGLGAMIPEHMDPCLCTHIIYAFSELKDHKLVPMEKEDHADGDKGGFFERINSLKKQNPKLRTMLAVGGWDMGMAAFSAMVKDEKNIKKFVDSSIEYLRHHDFSGLDLDFEYPGIDWRGSAPDEKQAFTKLCKMLREGFEKEAKDTGNERLLLSAAVAGPKTTIDKAYEVDKVSEYIDWWGLMTYDLHGAWDTNAGHHSALTGKDKQDYLYIDFIIKYYESKGAPRNKLVMGLANYGRSDAPAMPYTGFKGESGFLSYYEACLMVSCEGWKEFWNDKQDVPYAKGKENYPWAGYDNVKSMQIKAKYVKDENLAGVMFWTVDLDDFTGKFCCQGHFPLIRTVKSVLENRPEIMPSTSYCDKCPSTDYKTVKKKNNKKRSIDDICTEKGEGVWGDTEDCTKYYICRSLSTTWAEKKQETCYTGSYFEGGSCKWVGAGNFDCATVLGESSDTDKPKKEGSNDKKEKKTNSRSSQIDESGIMPKNLYTCKADEPKESDASADLFKCHQCESDPKNPEKCKQLDAANTINCNSKNQACFTKSIFDSNGKLDAFSRGCASLKDLEAALSNSDQKGVKMNVISCVTKNNKMKTCFVVCDSAMCNTIGEMKTSDASFLGRTTILIVLTFLTLF